jgi:hypothetical protein
MEENFSRVLQEISQLRMQDAFRVQPYQLMTGLDESLWPRIGVAGVELPKVTVLGDVMTGTIKAPVEPVEGRQRKGGTSAPSVNNTQKTDEKKDKP